MTPELLPGFSGSHLGLIGTRQLVCVQTFNIARLTSHPVALIPGHFIAVTGKGPKDSNESGKTSFLAAVSLLLGDPEWRTGGTGAANVSTLLYDAATAGDATTAHAASEGYVVGVFAEPGHSRTTAHSVWLRISSRTPHVLIRHAPGVHLVAAHDDQERHELAPNRFHALGGQPLGGGEYPTILYGRTPRVLAYVATRGKVRSRPSLLKLDAGTFTPEQIGDTLLSVTGRAALFENDADIRRRLADTQTRMQDVLEDNKSKTAREEIIRKQVAARNRLREQTQQAAKQWRSYRARRLLDTYARASSASAPLATVETEAGALQRAISEMQNQQTRLRDITALRDDAQEKSRRMREAEKACDAAVRAETRLTDQLGGLEQQVSEARAIAAGYDLLRDGDMTTAAENADAAATTLAQAEDEQAKANAAAKQAEEALAQARDGQVGLAGAYIRTLRTAGVTAVGLAERTRLATDGRTRWEARLAPWRDAVCVPRGDLEGALKALSGSPGALIISPELEPETEPSVHVATPRREWPVGVLDAPPEAAELLHALAAQTPSDVPIQYVTDRATGVHTVGGFTDPIVGKEDICAYFTEQLHRAQERLRDAGRKLASAKNTHERASDTLERARAAHLVQDVEPRIVEFGGQLANMRAEILPNLREVRDTARAEEADARQALKSRDAELNTLGGKLSKARKDAEAKQREIERLRAACRPDDGILSEWPWGVPRALAQLRWPADALDTTPDALVDQADPPAPQPGIADMERLPADAMARAARSQLTAIVAALGLDGDEAGNLGPGLASAAMLYQQSQNSGDEDTDGSLFDATLDTVQTWLDSSKDRDATAEEQISHQQAKRHRENHYIATQVEQLASELAATQQAIIQRAQTRLDAIGAALNTLNRAAGGLGTDLEYHVTPPSAPDDDWVCQVTPRWRRNTGGRLLAYDTVTNTAQEKLFSIHLVLAALLAAPQPSGRVLILDELGDSLGVEHRRDVLAAIATVAAHHGITVLGTCQDSIMVEARSFCGEILYFHYPSKSEALNRPTRMFGYDTNGERVELTAESLTPGRGLQ
jgi:chromosome segregation protein